MTSDIKTHKSILRTRRYYGLKRWVPTSPLYRLSLCILILY